MTPRWCANGDGCVSAPALGGPAPLSRSNADCICYACQENRLDEQLTPPSGRSFSLTEAAGLLGVPRKRVDYLIVSGQLRAQKVGSRGLRMIAEDDLVKLLEETA